VTASTAARRWPRLSASGRSRRRPRALLALGIVVVIVACSGIASVLAYASLKEQAGQLQAQLTIHLQIGQSQLEAAKASLHSANGTHDQNFISQAKVQFTSAKVQFMVAQQLADSSQLLQRLESLPDIGQMAQSRHAAVDGIAEMGVAISDAGQELTQLDEQLIKPASTGGQQGRTLLTVLNDTNSSLTIVRQDLELAQKAAAQVVVSVLPANQRSAFDKARGTISSALAAVDEFERLVPVITELLGGNGARTYLIEQVNPSELRPGGGFIGTYSLLQANEGSLKLIRSGNAIDFVPGFLTNTRPAPGQRGYVVPPGPIREFIPGTSWSFIDSNFFPDFASNAQAAESFAQPFVGTHIDAVISMDYYTVARMLELTGPLVVPGYGITLNSGNFVPIVVDHDLADDSIHKAILVAVAGTLMNRIATLSPDQWPALLTALNDLSASRHLQTFFNNAVVEKEIDRVGWSGALNPTGSRDYMMEVEANLGGTKANYFVARHYTVELTRTGSTLHHKVTVDLTDNMPFAFRPREYYSAYVRLYVSDTALSTSDNLRPVKYPNPAPPPGTRIIDGWVPLFHGYGHSAQAVFEYDTPWTADRRGEATIYWQKQPGTLNDAVTVKWNDGSGHSYTASGDLAQDRVISFSTSGVIIAPGQPAQAQLPSLSLG
jgi:Protein of unknown function (DUF4012)